jgi:hypothetical protein
MAKPIRRLTKRSAGTDDDGSNGKNSLLDALKQARSLSSDDRNAATAEEGLRLITSFMRICDPTVRAAVNNIVAELAKNGSGGRSL